MDSPWDYAFFIDADFTDLAAYRQAIDRMHEEFGELKIIGEYHNRKG
jgi:prephenate dehydratase